MGCCYGGVNTSCRSGVESRFACETGSDPMGLALVSEPFPVGRDPPRAELQAKKIPAEARSFFVGAQERTRTSTGFTR